MIFNNYEQGPCRGDAGGPLYIDHGDNNITIEGIVLGGVGSCGSNQARLYTRVSHHKDWISCIVDGINEGKSKEDIEDLCNEPFYDFDISIRGDDDIYGDDTIFQLDF